MFVTVGTREDDNDAKSLPAPLKNNSTIARSTKISPFQNQITLSSITVFYDQKLLIGSNFQH